MKHALKLVPATLLTLSMAAQANVTIAIEQTSTGVIVQGSGHIITDNEHCGLPEINATSVDSKNTESEFQMNSSSPSLFFGGAQNGLSCFFHNADRTGTPIGSNSALVKGRHFDDVFGVLANPSDASEITLLLPADYNSGDDLRFSALFAGKTLQDLGLINGGGYQWTWQTTQATGPLTSITIQSLSIVVRGASVSLPDSTTPVPALGTFGLMGLASAIVAAGVAMMRRRKSS